MLMFMPIALSSSARRRLRRAATLALLTAGATTQAATLHVTNLNDAGPGSLRATVQAAVNGDVVTFDVGGAITLASVIPIDRNLTIEVPPGGAAVQISGGGAAIPLFRVGVGAAAALTRLSLLNAQNAVQNNGNLTLTQVLVRGNTGSVGAGVSGCVDPATQTLGVIDSVFMDNHATNGGGAIGACSAITISGSTFSGNTAGQGGGGYGGALAVTNTGSVTITNSTFQGNTAGGFGGAIATDYPGMSLTNVTFSGNTATTGSALSVAGGVGVTVRNTVFASGTGGGHCTNPISAGSNNLNFADPAGVNSCGPTVTVTTDPQLGALGDSGGPTPTMALPAGSPAIDAGVLAGAPASDQRGISRPQGAGVDIGAYERLAAAPPLPGGVAAVPTLGEWGLMMLGLLAAGVGARNLRQRR